MPDRSWNPRSTGGAHQVALPVSRITAGTSSVRITIASISTASGMPSPGILVLVTRDIPTPTITTARMTAAAVIIPPVRRSPKTMDACTGKSVAGATSRVLPTSS